MVTSLKVCWLGLSFSLSLTHYIASLYEDVIFPFRLTVPWRININTTDQQIRDSGQMLLTVPGRLVKWDILFKCR